MAEEIIQSKLNKALINKWVLFFNIPEPLKKVEKFNSISKHVINGDSVQFALKAADVPDTTVRAISQRYASGNLHVTSFSKDAYDPLTIKFNVDNNFANWGTIYEWLNFIHDEKEAYPDPENKIDKPISHRVFSYWTTLGLMALDEYNKAIVCFYFTLAFPTKISGISFDYSRSDQIEATATFAFSQIHTEYFNDKNIVLSPNP